ILSAALTVLTKEEREVVFLHINNDLKHREISKVINKPLGTVLWIYNKAIKKLKDYFEKNGGVSNE
ncbi:MAG: sigma factor-like helix-turn-helix DNA-binding protein, partial [Bacilli bacterium]